MKQALVISVLLVGIGAVGSARQRAARQHATESSAADPYSSVKLHNADVTVRRFNIPAGASAPVSAATHDYLLVSIGQSSLAAVGNNSNFEFKLGDGEMQVLQGGWSHKLVNQSQDAAQVIAVELTRNFAPQSAVCGLSTHGCHEVRYGTSAEGEYQQVTAFETDTAKVFRVHMGSQVTMHQHSDGRKHLIVALSPLEAHADQQTFKLQPGETYWIPGGFDDLGNDGPSEAHLLIVELKD